MLKIKNRFLVALADDDKDDCLLFSEALDEISMDTQLLVFSNGQDLIDYLLHPKSIVPRIIFLDLNMPKLHGIDTLKAIKSHKRFDAIKIVIYSTSSAENDVYETFVLGANTYLVKPNSYQELKDSLTKALSTIGDTTKMDARKRSNFILKV